jgi:hypothetical protein
MKRSFATLGSVLVLLASACGGGHVPAVSADRASGQSGLMDQTFAGKNKCSPKNHDRPFVVEWDATDMSQFESLTASDIVFARYEGCELKIVDSCKNDSVKGALGSYKTVEWTSGSVEKVDIKSEGELYAKLPLGVASLGARVAGGETFLMEYFVAGTRTATRPSQSKAELAKVPGCKGVTHFVYAYNLGAFALGSTKNIKAEAGVSVWGAGAGGSSKYASAAEKKGGLLASCRGESAREVESCKTPIRLTLREIEDEKNTEHKAEKMPDTAESRTEAAAIKADLDQAKKAGAHAASANEKMQAGDGKGCLAELDMSDKGNETSNPQLLSTNPHGLLFSRARCLMLAGQCPAGKVQMRKFMQAQGTVFGSPEQIDTKVDAQAGLYCQGASMSKRDRLLKVRQEFQDSAMTRKSASECKQKYTDFKSAREGVEPKDEDDVMVASAKAMDPEFTLSQCLARARECSDSWAMFRKSRLGASSGVETFRNMTVGCKEFVVKESDARDSNQDAKDAGAHMSAAAQKMGAKDGKGCLADLDTYDKLVKPEDRTTVSGKGSTRAICLMLASRCDEGETLQRAELAKQGVAQNIIDMNIKSVRSSWCK